MIMSPFKDKSESKWKRMTHVQEFIEENIQKT